MSIGVHEVSAGKGCLVWAFVLLLPFGFLISNGAPAWTRPLCAVLVIALGGLAHLKEKKLPGFVWAAGFIGTLFLFTSAQEVYRQHEAETAARAREAAEASARIAALTEITNGVPAIDAEVEQVRTWIDTIAPELAPFRHPPARSEGLESALNELVTSLLQRSEEQAQNALWRESHELFVLADRVATLGLVPVSALEAAGDVSDRFQPQWEAGAVCASANTTIGREFEDAAQADDAYARELDRLEAIDDEVLSNVCGEDALALVPRIERLQRGVSRQAGRIRQRNQEVNAQLERCGPAPTVGGFRDNISGAEAFLRRTAHDSESIRVERCRQPMLANDRSRCWMTICDVLGRNMLGARIRNRYVFETANFQVRSAERL